MIGSRRPRLAASTKLDRRCGRCASRGVDGVGDSTSLRSHSILFRVFRHEPMEKSNMNRANARIRVLLTYLTSIAIAA